MGGRKLCTLILVCCPRCQDAADVNLTEVEVEKIAHDIEVKLFNVHNQVMRYFEGQSLLCAGNILLFACVGGHKQVSK